jgi:prepilin-type N-terminal cleavage/methylation domain-containing protein
MKSQQSGFTLVEIAIVLVIIGLLLGGVLKGQELINSAKVKAMATDFRNIQTALYGYQDRFKALPGDHPSASTAISGATNAAATALGNGQITGNWNSTSNTDESCLVWQHLRLANFQAGPTVVDCGNGPPLPEYVPKNADGGRIGLSSAISGTGGNLQITGMTGSFQICSAGILGKFAKQLDTQLDDGNTATGSVRVQKYTTSPAAVNTAAATATSDVGDGDISVVCMTF